MRNRALPFVILLLLSGPARAQVLWQPAQAPLVTAENESWFRAGEAIDWNGERYLQAGAPEAFNRYQMVRSGSYRGIPLYTDATLEPYSIVFVPISGGRMQPYERPRTGMLAGTVGSRTSSFPTVTSTEQTAALGMTNEGFVAQAPAPPTFAPAYDLGAGPATAAAASAAPVSVAMAGNTAAPRAIGTSGRVSPPATRTAVPNRVATAAVPSGVNGIWLDYNGRRWVSAGRAVELSHDFTRTGRYRDSPVYQRAGDNQRIYVPLSGDLLVPFKLGDR